jgi:hypothetical protein
MNKVILDPAWRSRLASAGGTVELRDESGWIVGYYLPREVHAHLLRTWALAQCPPGFPPAVNGQPAPPSSDRELGAGKTMVTLDPGTLPAQVDLYTPAEWCDPDGNVLGLYQPLYADAEAKSHHKRQVYDWLNAQVTDEELERARQETGGRTLAEIWRGLGCA